MDLAERWLTGDRDDPPNMQAIRMVPTNLEGMMTRKELTGRYAEKMGIPVAHIDFYYCFGLFVWR